MMRNDYRRSLILLRSNASGYSGHVRLERRTLMGTMYFLVQSPGDCPALRAALVGRGRDGVYYACALGELQQDARGQAVLGYSFDPRDICRRELEQYQLAAITCAGDESCQVVLFGNICGHAELNWEGVRGALCELYAAQDAAQNAAQAEAEAPNVAAQNEPEVEAQSGRSAQSDTSGTQAEAGEMSSASGAQANAGAQSNAGGAQANAGALSSGSGAQANSGERSGASGAQAESNAQIVHSARTNIDAQPGTGGAQADAGALDGRGAQAGAEVQPDISGAQADAAALDGQGTGADECAQSGFGAVRMGDAALPGQQVGPAAEPLTASVPEDIPRAPGNGTIHGADADSMVPGDGTPTTAAQPSDFMQGEASPNGTDQNAAHFNGAAQALDGERAQAMESSCQRIAPEQSAQPKGTQISAQYGVEQTTEAQSATGQIDEAGDGIGAISEAQFAIGQVGAAENEIEPEARAQPNAGQFGAIQYDVGQAAGAQSAFGQIGAAEYDAGQSVDEPGGVARTGGMLACDLLEERGVSASSPWPGAAEALRPLFRTEPALADAPDDQCVYVEAPMPEGSGFPFVAAGILALGGALTAIRYALPATWTEEPPVGLEDCIWIGDQNTGWWLTELPVG